MNNQRKLFLTSAGLPKETRDYFLSLLKKKPSETNVAFIPTAADPEEDKWFVESDKNQLKEIGVQIKEIDLKRENKNSLLSKFSKCDVIHVGGGNTFYLLDWIRKSGFDKIINKLLDNGKIYVGVSAGSIIAGPSIEVAGWKHFDRNIVNLKDLTGLNLVSFIPFVHYEDQHKKLLEEKSKNENFSIIALNDKQAVLCINGKYEIVGEGEKLVYNISKK